MIFQRVGDVIQKAEAWYFKPKFFERWKNGKIYGILQGKAISGLVDSLESLLDEIDSLSGLDDDFASSEAELRRIARRRETLENLEKRYNRTCFAEKLSVPLTLLFGYYSYKYFCKRDMNSFGILFGASLLSFYSAMGARYRRVLVTNSYEKKSQVKNPE